MTIFLWSFWIIFKYLYGTVRPSYFMLIFLVSGVPAQHLRLKTWSQCRNKKLKYILYKINPGLIFDLTPYAPILGLYDFDELWFFIIFAFSEYFRNSINRKVIFLLINKSQCHWNYDPHFEIHNFISIYIINYHNCHPTTPLSWIR